MRRSTLLAAVRALGALALAASAAACAAATTSLPLKVAHRDIPLGGKADRFDYESVDARRRLLFIAHLGSGIVTAFDLRNDRIVQQVMDVAGVHGVLAVPQLGEVFATATDRNELDIISERSFQIIAKVPAGVYPDGMTYDPREHKLFISDEAGDTETIVDTRSKRRVATLAMGGEVGNSQYDPVSKLVFVDVQTRGDIAAIDPRTDRIVHRYPLPATCDDDHSLLLDVPARLAFVACDGNAKLLLVDLRTMHVLSIHDAGDGPDVLAFDAGLQRLYVATESGVVSVFQLRAQTLKLLGRAYLAFEAHSVAVDPATHEVYFPLQDIGGIGVLRIMAPTNP
jgi:DNA-binding beta-propeller fold protein YncE